MKKYSPAKVVLKIALALLVSATWLGTSVVQGGSYYSNPEQGNGTGRFLYMLNFDIAGHPAEEGDEVGAFRNGILRGSFTAWADGIFHSSMVFGENNDEIQFRVVDISRQREFAIVNIYTLQEVSMQGLPSVQFIPVVGVEVDTDGDGMCDYWERYYGLDENRAEGDDGAQGDIDEDGYTNLAEYNYGSDPTNPDSHPPPPTPSPTMTPSPTPTPTSTTTSSPTPTMTPTPSPTPPPTTTPTPIPQPTTWRVDADNTSGPWDGTRLQPYQYIQDAIDSANNGDTVLVAEGTYFENIDFNGKAITVTSYDPGDPTVVEATVIDGGENDSVVKIVSVEGMGARLSGFTVQNGQAIKGGGIYCEGSTARVTNNRIIDNAASEDEGGDGGGIYSSDSSITISYNTIDNNFTGDHGAGICSRDSSVTIVSNSITNNTGYYLGGGIYCEGSSAIIRGNAITGNRANDYGGGGGIALMGSSATIMSNSIVNNYASEAGGGIWLKDSTPVIIDIDNNTISGNSSSEGGGLSCNLYRDGSSMVLRNNMITENSASWAGGGIHCVGFPSPEIINNTICNNSVTYGGGYGWGGGIYCGTNSDPIILNSILWGNTASNGSQIYWADTGSAEVSYCVVQGGWDGDEIIDADPLFVGGDPFDYHLTANSPCIDVGLGGAGIPGVDIDPDPRPLDIPGVGWDGTGDEFDIGADEYSDCRWEGESELIAEDYSVSPACLVADENGNVMVVYNSDFQLYGRRFDGEVWQDPQQVSLSGSGYGDIFRRSDLAFDNNGDAICVFEQQVDHGSGEEPTLCVRKYYQAGDSWGTVVELDQYYASFSWPRIAIDGDNNAMVIYLRWHGQPEYKHHLYASRYDYGTDTWSSPEAIDDGYTIAGVSNECPIDIDSGDNGNFAVVFTYEDVSCVHHQVYANRYLVGGGWEGVERLDSLTSSGCAGCPRIAFDDQGDILAVYSEMCNGMDVYFSKHDGDVWSEPVVISDGTEGVFLDLDCNENGDAVCVWVQHGWEQDIYGSFYDGSVWSLPELLTTCKSYCDDEQCFVHPHVAVGANGTAMTVFERWSGSCSTGVYGAISVDGIWSDAFYIGSGRHDSVAIGAGGEGYVLYRDYIDGHYSLFVHRYTCQPAPPTPTPPPSATPTPSPIRTPSPSPTPENYICRLNLDYSTYLGGAGNDNAFALAVDASGCAYICGNTSSTDFPLQNPYQSDTESWNAFVSKLSSTGSTLIYSTYVGGDQDDSGTGIAVEADGSAYITGSTASIDFPTLNPFQASHAAGLKDVFVSKLSSSGSALVYSSYLGGDNYDHGGGISVENGSAYVAGWTRSSNFPARNPYQSVYAGGFSDIFVSKVSSTGSSLVYSTYLGGEDTDYGDGIFTENGSAYICGLTRSTDFPTENPYCSTYIGNGDAFISKLSSTGSALVYSTYFGGIGSEESCGISVKNSLTYITGYTNSADFPTVNPYQPALVGVADAFISKISSTGSALIYSTYLGGSSEESSKAIAVGTDGFAYITGYTFSTDFPTRNPFQAGHAGGEEDIFISKLSDTGSALIYSTYLGGDFDEIGRGIYVQGSSAYVSGGTTSLNFPSVNPYQASSGGTNDAFISKFSWVSYLTSPTPTPSEPGEGGITPTPTPAGGTGGAATPTPQEPPPTPTRTPLPRLTPTPTSVPSVTPTAPPTVTPTPTITPSITPTSTATPTLSPTPTPSPIPTSTPSPSVTPTTPPTPSVTPTCTPVSPTPTPTVNPTPTPFYFVIESGDYDGNGVSDIAIFRPATGLWAVKDVGRTYHGMIGDVPVSGDYDGDGFTHMAFFRPGTGLWNIDHLTTFYFGKIDDMPVPGDYDGDGTCDVAVFRKTAGLWAIRDITRSYYGSAEDLPVPGDYDWDGSAEIAIFRPATGLWAIRGYSRCYFGAGGDIPVSAEYQNYANPASRGKWRSKIAIFRPATGLWAIRGYTRCFFGQVADMPFPGDYDGDSLDDIGIFRPGNGLWAVKGITRTYFGAKGDLPVTR